MAHRPKRSNDQVMHIEWRNILLAAAVLVVVIAAASIGINLMAVHLASHPAFIYFCIFREALIQETSYTFWIIYF